MKRCYDCGELKPLSDFAKRLHYHLSCKQCTHQSRSAPNGKRRGPRAHRPETNAAPVAPSVAGLPYGYAVGYSSGVDRWRVTLPDGRVHWLAPGADKGDATGWAHRHEQGKAHGFCSSPAVHALPKRKPMDDVELVERLRRNREEAQS